MSRICDLTGKGSLVGNNVSNSNVKTKRRFHPNLKLKKFYIPEEDKWITLKVSTSAVKTISKNGISACISKFVKKGLSQNTNLNIYFGTYLNHLLKTIGIYIEKCIRLYTKPKCPTNLLRILRILGGILY